MSNINNRILQIANYYSVSKPADFAKRTGFSHQVSSNYLKGARIPNADALCVIKQSFDVSADWLLTGNGDMISLENKESNNIPTARPFTSSFEGIPLIPFSAMAGAMSGEITAMEYECDRYVIPAFKGAEFLIPVKGLSMYPKYSSGDIVACKRVPLVDIFFQWGKVYVLDTDQGALIKRIKPTTDPLQILIVSDNPSYDPFTLPLTAIHSIALVIGVIRLE